jgi:N-acetylglutamate synthase-like GNAT family acetyltransferase
MIRKANVSDTEAIKALKDTIWPSDSTSQEHIKTILNNPNLTTLVHETETKITGLATAFITTSQDNIKRWEIDLLAVHPNYQRQGIAKNLINHITKTGQKQNAQIARALIQIENVASQKTFKTCGYTKDNNTQMLYTSDTENTHTPHLTTNYHLIPVSTLNYNGVWIEGKLTPEAFTSAQALRTKHQWDIAGATIPHTDELTITIAEANHFTFISRFQWWIYHFKQDADPMQP